jgi:hypothetical protein
LSVSFFGEFFIALLRDIRLYLPAIQSEEEGQKNRSVNRFKKKLDERYILHRILYHNFNAKSGQGKIFNKTGTVIDTTL